MEWPDGDRSDPGCDDAVSAGRLYAGRSDGGDQGGDSFGSASSDDHDHNPWYRQMQCDLRGDRAFFGGPGKYSQTVQTDHRDPEDRSGACDGGLQNGAGSDDRIGPCSSADAVGNDVCICVGRPHHGGGGS